MSFLSKTLGGLSKAYYIRQFLGLIFFAFMVVVGYNIYSHTGNLSIFLTNIILGLDWFVYSYIPILELFMKVLLNIF